VLGAISASHLINDMMQSLILAIYPILKGDFQLSFVQIGLITLTYQLTASLFQPLVGLYTDRARRRIVAGRHDIHPVRAAAARLRAEFRHRAGRGGLCRHGPRRSFHPESSRVARMASGGRHGLAQSLFQVGGNTGSAIGPLVAAAVIVPFGQRSVAWFALAALLGIVLLLQVGRWYAHHHVAAAARAARRPASQPLAAQCGRGRDRGTAAADLLEVLLHRGHQQLLSLLRDGKFGLSVQNAQLHLFIFLFASALGTLVGGPVGDRIGRKPVIWVSILGVAPFALMLPHANLFWTTALTIVIGFILSSAFSAIVVYAQELIPGKVGMSRGCSSVLRSAWAGLGAAVLGLLAGPPSIDFVYHVIAYLPLLGVVAVLLPNITRPALPC